MLLAQLFALGLERNALLLDDSFDCLLDVVVLDAGEFLQGMPVIETVAARKHERPGYHEPEEHAVLVDAPDKGYAAVEVVVVPFEVVGDGHEFVRLEALRHHAEVLVQ